MFFVIPPDTHEEFSFYSLQLKALQNDFQIVLLCVYEDNKKMFCFHTHSQNEY